MENLANFEAFSEKYRRTRKMKKTIFGILAVIVGLLLLGFNLDILNSSWRHFIFSWQMLLIAIGLINVFDKESFGTGVILILTGSIFMVPEFMDVPIKIRQIFWPVMIILGGIVLISKYQFNKRGSKFHRFWKSKTNKGQFFSNTISEQGTINETNIFGGSKRIFDGPVFKGGEITNIFGGGEIDLRHSTLAEGRVVLDVTTVFGGVSIIVPSDWIIHLEINSILGGFQDKRMFKPRIEVPGSGNELVIKGLALFGGGEIKSV